MESDQTIIFNVTGLVTNKLNVLQKCSNIYGKKKIFKVSKSKSKSFNDFFFDFFLIKISVSSAEIHYHLHL